jgi:hypothetical protein
MEKYRRIEIVAFRKRVSIVSGNFGDDERSVRAASAVELKNDESRETIDRESPEGQRLIFDAIHLLEEQIIKRTIAY